ncbi:ParB N-terminal domain-containing protein [Methylomonas koyamae]|uniref:ParB N-terminal domain-containing protein n=1 Tax=Methylomonas koyamae TaxID=702114 RepID=UPI002873DB9F|nr:ParB N-terminal domain-containing protein [Methylomonas koyamae]WNB75702.1 ParB N-terminal domain-containing protein [Methylomonas koyamae]
MNTHQAAIAELKADIQNGKPRPEKAPTSLPLDSIDTREDVFQYRIALNYSSRAHIDQLKQVLTMGAPNKRLTKIAVMWDGRGYVCIDGHHRLQAYRAAGVTTKIPVTVHTGSVEEALLIALLTNTRNKLDMTAKDRTSAAWRLTVTMPKLSKEEVSANTGVSGRTVGYMRSALRRFKEMFPGEPIPETHHEANKLLEGKPVNTDRDPDWLEVEAQKVAERLHTHFGKKPHESPAVFARGIELYSDQVVKYILEEWEFPERDEEEDNTEDDTISDYNDDF